MNTALGELRRVAYVPLSVMSDEKAPASPTPSDKGVSEDVQALVSRKEARLLAQAGLSKVSVLLSDPLQASR
ncbi:hypothetical protein MKEN_01040900 [Mycena kentingensis (nom. inval.)]|nr:hypothetical protein MKEN_01040900 [Mycena kentingensis (nom. inval.)]